MYDLATTGTTTVAAAVLKQIYLVFSCILVVVGYSGSPLFTRLYFIHGGKRLWLTACVQTAAWPINLITLLLAYVMRKRHRRRGGADNNDSRLFVMKPFLLVCSASIGLLFGFIDYFYAYGTSKLPVSTSSLIYATQLGFNSVFAYLLVKQRFSGYSINTVFSMTAGAVALALYSSSDDGGGGGGLREYIVGFAMMCVATVSIGLALPLMELSFKKANHAMSFTLATEFNVVLCLVATLFCTIGMLFNNDFEAIAMEARRYELGEARYYVVLTLMAISSQCALVGTNGVIFCCSSLLSGIMVAVALPLTEVLAVVFFGENMHAGKVICLALTLWGFLTYFYGEIKYSKNQDRSSGLESLLLISEDHEYTSC